MNKIFIVTFEERRNLVLKLPLDDNEDYIKVIIFSQREYDGCYKLLQKTIVIVSTSRPIPLHTGVPSRKKI